MRNKAGFTLLELLIALFIFTLIAAIITGALHTVFTAQSAREKKATQLTDLQIALTLITRDTEQIIDRPIIKTNGTPSAAFIGRNNFMEFTHGGWVNPFGESIRSTLQRTAYYVEKNKLIREAWPTLDQTPQTTSMKRILLTGVTQFQLEYLDKEGHFKASWLPEDQANEFPRAIRVLIVLKNSGKITQLIVIPGTQLGKPKTT